MGFVFLVIDFDILNCVCQPPRGDLLVSDDFAFEDQPQIDAVVDPATGKAFFNCSIEPVRYQGRPVPLRFNWIKVSPDGHQMSLQTTTSWDSYHLLARHALTVGDKVLEILSRLFHESLGFFGILMSLSSSWEEQQWRRTAGPRSTAPLLHGIWWQVRAPAGDLFSWPLTRHVDKRHRQLSYHCFCDRRSCGFDNCFYWQKM